MREREREGKSGGGSEDREEGSATRGAPARLGRSGGMNVQGGGDKLGAHDPFRIDTRREEEARPRSCSSRRAVTRQGGGGWSGMDWIGLVVGWALKTKRVAAGMDWIDGTMGQDP